jgi:hypothetical protein
VVGTPIEYSASTKHRTFGCGISIQALEPIIWERAVHKDSFSRNDVDYLKNTKFWLCASKMVTDIQGNLAAGEQGINTDSNDCAPQEKGGGLPLTILRFHLDVKRASRRGEFLIVLSVFQEFDSGLSQRACRGNPPGLQPPMPIAVRRSASRSTRSQQCRTRVTPVCG